MRILKRYMLGAGIEGSKREKGLKNDPGFLAGAMG